VSKDIERIRRQRVREDGENTLSSSSLDSLNVAFPQSSPQRYTYSLRFLFDIVFSPSSRTRCLRIHSISLLTQSSPRRHIYSVFSTLRLLILLFDIVFTLLSLCHHILSGFTHSRQSSRILSWAFINCGRSTMRKQSRSWHLHWKGDTWAARLFILSSSGSMSVYGLSSVSRLHVAELAHRVAKTLPCALFFFGPQD